MLYPSAHCCWWDRIGSGGGGGSGAEPACGCRGHERQGHHRLPRRPRVCDSLIYGRELELNLWPCILINVRTHVVAGSKVLALPVARRQPASCGSHARRPGCQLEPLGRVAMPARPPWWSRPRPAQFLPNQHQVAIATSMPSRLRTASSLISRITDAITSIHSTVPSFYYQLHAVTAAHVMSGHVQL